MSTPIQVHAPWMPDMKRNTALAGKTVSAKGMNVTYDDRGYAVKAVKFGSKYFKGTAQGVRAPSVDAVLSAGNRVSNTGSAKDLEYFSDYDLQHVEEWRRQVEAGVITADQAYTYLEELRGEYGYSCGPDGNQFVKLEPTRRPGEAYIEEQMAKSAQTAATVALAQPVVGEAENGQSAVLAPPVAAADETELLQGMQDRLRRQQDEQAIRAELNDLRADRMLRSMGEEKKDELFGILFEEDEKEKEGG